MRIICERCQQRTALHQAEMEVERNSTKGWKIMFEIGALGVLCAYLPSWTTGSVAADAFLALLLAAPYVAWRLIPFWRKSIRDLKRLDLLIDSTP